MVLTIDKIYKYMKIDDLKKAIRGLIREEVKKVVAEEVSKAMGKVLVEMVKEIKTPKINKQDINEEYIKEESPFKPAIIKTNNSKLNSVLAETARNFRPLKKTIDSNLVELMDGGFDKVGQDEEINISQPSTNMDFLKQMVGETPVQTQKSVLDSNNEIPDCLKKVFKKDFRAVMKKMDEQKNGAGGGYIDPSKVLMDS